MLWKIEKSLGNVAAVQVDSMPESGVCVEFRNYRQPNASILIYKNGKLKDISINGHVFPCVYNKVSQHGGWDRLGGHHNHLVNFDFANMDDSIYSISRTIYGNTESITVEYFYTLLYNISCCADKEQYKQLYRCIIDTKSVTMDRSMALETLNFIEEFTPQLSEIEDTTYLQGLKQKLNTRFKEAQKVISKSECPE